MPTDHSQARQVSAVYSAMVVEELYDRWAARYDQDGADSPYYSYLDLRYRELVSSSLACLERRAIVEMGCGSGNHTVLISRGAAYCLGIDFSNELLKVALRKAKDLELSARTDFILADVRMLPIKDGGVQGAISLGQVFGHFPSPQRGAKEAARVLTAEGFFMLEFDNKWSVDFLHYALDALTRGKLLRLGFPRFSLLKSYVTTGEYAWNISADKFSVSSSISFYKVPFRDVMRSLKRVKLDVRQTYGLHILTLFFPAGMQEATSSAFVRKYVNVMSKVDRTISGVRPFNMLGASVVFQGVKL